MPQTRKNFKILGRLLIIFIFIQAFTFQICYSQANLEELEHWADSTYDTYYKTNDIIIAELDSVLFLFPADQMSVGKEKLYRILASFYHNSGQPHVAFPYLIEIEKSLRNRKDSSRLPLVISGLAESYRSFGKLDIAVEYALEGVAMADRFGTDLDKGYTHGRLGAIYFQWLSSNNVSKLIIL